MSKKSNATPAGLPGSSTRIRVANLSIPKNFSLKFGCRANCVSASSTPSTFVVKDRKLVVPIGGITMLLKVMTCPGLNPDARLSSSLSFHAASSGQSVPQIDSQNPLQPVGEILG